MGASVGTYNGVTGVHFWNFYTGSRQDVVSIAVPPDTWVHIAWVLGNGILAGYVNGVLQMEATHGPTASTGVFGIGRMFQDGSTRTPISLYPSMIQHVATFPVALPAERIRAQAVALGLARPVMSYRSCHEVLQAGESTGDGVYFLTPADAGEAIPLYCDMTTEGGGWTRLAGARWSFFFDASKRGELQPVRPHGGQLLDPVDAKPFCQRSYLHLPPRGRERGQLADRCARPLHRLAAGPRPIHRDHGRFGLHVRFGRGVFHLRGIQRPA